MGTGFWYWFNLTGIITAAVLAFVVLPYVAFKVTEAVFATRPHPSPRVRAAEHRWTAHNAAARTAGCPCGQPATEVRYDHRNLGSVPVETWTCVEHVGAEMWSGNRPAWGHDQELEGVECWGSSGPIGGPHTRWYHPVKPEEATR